MSTVWNGLYIHISLSKTLNLKKNQLSKFFLLLVFTAISNNFFSQEIKLSPLTQVMLKKHYAEDELKVLSKDLDKLKLLEYYYSSSFELIGNKSIEDNQLFKVDVNNFRLIRKVDEDVIYFDEISKLQLKLYSLNKMELDKKKLVPTYKTDSESISKSNN